MPEIIDVWKVESDDLPSSLVCTQDEAIEVAQGLIRGVWSDEKPVTIKVTRYQMEREAFEALPEFEG